MPNKLNRLKDFFGYSTSEKRGILILSVLLILLILFNIFLPRFFKPNIADFTEFEQKILAFEKRQKEISDSLQASKLARNNYHQTNKEINLNPFYFDPNNLPAEDWKKLGLQEWQIEVIKNYESKGGKFNKPNDLAKIYSITEKEYKILEPYIRISVKSDASSLSVINPSLFDPNKATKEDLQKMNIRESLVNAIISYREKGGKFYKKEDLQKIYIITDQEYEILEPFVFIEKDTIQIAGKSFDSTDTLIIDINRADTLDLQQLRGIGPSFSRRIIKYRDLLGGYCDKDQLLEVYGMEENRYNGIKDHIRVDESLVQKININQATIKDLIKHPYIEFYVAKSIVTYREEIGSYRSLDDIKNAKLIYEELFNKLIPYLTIN